jgi:hypothetical protein
MKVKLIESKIFHEAGVDYLVPPVELEHIQYMYIMKMIFINYSIIGIALKIGNILSK